MSEGAGHSPLLQSEVVLNETSCSAAAEGEQAQLDTLSVEVQTGITANDIKSSRPAKWCVPGNCQP